MGVWGAAYGDYGVAAPSYRTGGQAKATAGWGGDKAPIKKMRESEHSGVIFCKFATVVEDHAKKAAKAAAVKAATAAAIKGKY